MPVALQEEVETEYDYQHDYDRPLTVRDTDGYGDLRPSRREIGVSSPVARGRRRASARPRESDWHQTRDLLEHFDGSKAARHEKERVDFQVSREERRRKKLRHRPFRLSLLAITTVLTPLSLVISLLWVNGICSAMNNRSSALVSQINDTRFQLERARQDIATVNASTRVDQLAQNKGWRPASQQEFDQMPLATNSLNETDSDSGTAPDAEVGNR